MKTIAKFFLGKKALQSFWRLLFLLGLKGMNFGGGSSFKESGEEWTLNYFAKKAAGPTVLFDVGANRGGYALAAADILGKANAGYKIFCFEPAKKTFELLQKNVGADGNISCFNFALGDSAARLKLYFNAEVSGLASLYERDELAVGRTEVFSEEVMVETLDNFCAQNNIASVDFLKLDVEGNEFKALQGGKDLLERRKIKFIQFEFGGTDIDSRIFFRDFFKLLSPNYDLYRILKNGLQPIKNYKETDEIFITTNYLAILK